MVVPQLNIKNDHSNVSVAAGSLAPVGVSVQAGHGSVAAGPSVPVPSIHAVGGRVAVQAVESVGVSLGVGGGGEELRLGGPPAEVEGVEGQHPGPVGGGPHVAHPGGVEGHSGAVGLGAPLAVVADPGVAVDGAADEAGGAVVRLSLPLAVEVAGVAEGGGADVAHAGGVEGHPSTVGLGLALADKVHGSAAEAGGLGHGAEGSDHRAAGPLELGVSLGLGHGYGRHTGNNHKSFHVASDRS